MYAYTYEEPITQRTINLILLIRLIEIQPLSPTIDRLLPNVPLRIIQHGHQTPRNCFSVRQEGAVLDFAGEGAEAAEGNGSDFLLLLKL